MKETLRLVVVLTLICVIAGVLLAWVNTLSAGPIAEAQRAERMQAITLVLPPYDNAPDSNVAAVEYKGRTWSFYVARSNGAYAGAAFESTSRNGYGGNITVMVGVNANGKVHGIEILEQKETPGLGARIEDKGFRNRFEGRDIRSTTWAVKKDRGDIDQITAATISSRAVVEAVREGLDAYVANEESIRATGA